ncbi:Fur family transcriptional regulator [Aneurinibacillus uraniidurans]|uniref:ferric iron uptake transcriptional regulator n=1 Tax=Aneurinibacillus uraniidurans TaxID=2966586 RepID=UPI002349A58A|nr:Fur family transcriptional regulator [Aneurinibacillus sp. B1]WCN36863.1 Fur family transcriptional regulator [Aneurinibacillus sp. B1]
MEERIERIRQQLHESSYKLTPQREATLRVLLENEEKHLSAEEVWLLVKQKAPETGLATVYRTLELMSELGILDKVNFGDGAVRYDFRNEDAEHHHHHLICVECGTVDEIHEDLLGEVEQAVSEKFHFHILDHRLSFHGVCHRCIDNVDLDEVSKPKPQM